MFYFSRTERKRKAGDVEEGEVASSGDEAPAKRAKGAKSIDEELNGPVRESGDKRVVVAPEEDGPVNDSAQGSTKVSSADSSVMVRCDWKCLVSSG